MKNKRGRLPIIAGLLLIAAALCLTAYNLYEDYRAELAAQRTVTYLEPLLPSEEMVSPDSSIVEVSETIEPEPLQNTEPAPVTEIEITEIEIPDYILNPEMEMPVLQYEGQDYIGVLEIPMLELKIPIISEWSYPKLRIAPCRYAGSAYTNDMVIAAHNYGSHFGRIAELKEGNKVIFTDADGNRFVYEVVWKETLMPTDVEEMINSGFDLTLFTCTVGGSHRVTVRCDLVE